MGTKEIPRSQRILLVGVHAVHWACLWNRCAGRDPIPVWPRGSRCISAGYARPSQLDASARPRAGSWPPEYGLEIRSSCWIGACPCLCGVVGLATEFRAPGSLRYAVGRNLVLVVS